MNVDILGFSLILIVNVLMVFGYRFTKRKKGDKKTDFIRFKELYLSFGVKELNHTIEIDGSIVIKLNGWGRNKRAEFSGSYEGFYSTVSFDESGKFIGQGFYE